MGNRPPMRRLTWPPRADPMDVGECANCETRRPLDAAGLVVEHWAGRWRCLGSNQYPEPDIAPLSLPAAS
ncbi:hypothetical protein FRAHR75_770034 [Frankia sp. Hr75.2]|nr:hypothetical protein FRAHR75_770034 [Frankia sp. Hr75.2]